MAVADCWHGCSRLLVCLLAWLSVCLSVWLLPWLYQTSSLLSRTSVHAARRVRREGPVLGRHWGRVRVPGGPLPGVGPLRAEEGGGPDLQGQRTVRATQHVPPGHQDLHVHPGLLPAGRRLCAMYVGGWVGRGGGMVWVCLSVCV